MLNLFGNKEAVGVSITPERGLEVAQIDCATGQVLKYGRKQLDYNIVRKDIADFDLLKGKLGDLLDELGIPSRAELTISLPTVTFNVTDYRASWTPIEVESAIEETLYEIPYFKETEPSFAYSMVNSSLQSNTYVYTAVQKTSVVELIMMVKDLGYKLNAIGTSVDSVLNSLVYLNRVNIEPNTNWVLLIVENTCCRIVSLTGRDYLDYSDEDISIGKVLSDAENYTTVISTVEPILKNIPSKYLCVVSKTDVISAEILANKLSYSAPIIYQEDNSYRKDELLELSPFIDGDEAKSISLDAVGAGIYSVYTQTTPVKLNFFNHLLGGLYEMEQPPTVMGGKVVLTNEKLIGFFIMFLILAVAIIVLIFLWFLQEKTRLNTEKVDIDKKIAEADDYLSKHSNITPDMFDEGDQIKNGLAHNKGIYSYYTIVGTEIPQKLWLTHIKFGDNVTIEGQADNLESVYSFFKNIKDYNPDSDITLQKLGLALSDYHKTSDFDSESVLTTLDADFYEFRISNEPMSANVDSGASNDDNKSDVPQDLELID